MSVKTHPGFPSNLSVCIEAFDPSLLITKKSPCVTERVKRDRIFLENFFKIVFKCIKAESLVQV